jgi:serine/threonine protein kinase
MRNDEFVERFKREARAAGRLRHPNVVDVTDFGFAQAGADRLAYLVMEYLDGCTLGDVLAEEKRLPLEFVVDILEQAASAVHEAHQQGIVHRDLKPDNIWLEPNRLGAYRVKVLDFGIAKLAEVNEAGDLSQTSLPGNHSPGEKGLGGAVTPAAAASGKLTQRLAKTDLTINLTTDLPADREADTILFGNSPDGASQGAAAAADLVPTLIAAPAEAAAPGSEPPAVAGEPQGENLYLEGDQTQLFSSPPITVSAPSQFTNLESGADRFNELEGTQLFNQQTQHLDNKVTAHPNLTVSTEGLTRVGAIMGTPVYMSPEQCRGEHLDARADIYSLGVIAYQMLAGAPPFSGDVTTVMRLHIESAPQPLREQTRKLPKRVSQVVMATLSKDPSARPQTAQAFANSLRANADGLGALYRRAFALYSEYFPKFLKLSLIAHIPVITFTLLMVAWEVANKYLHAQPRGKAWIFMLCLKGLIGLGQVVAYFLAASAISGMTAVIVTQLAAAPLRPVELRTAFALLKKRWRPFLNTSIRMTLRILFFTLLGVIPGIVVSIRYALYAPVVLMEGLTKKAARLRARELGSRSWRTVISVLLLQFIIPSVLSGLIGFLSGRTNVHNEGLTFRVSNQLSGLVNIIVLPLMSIVPALLYLKMRQMGGETLNDAIAQIEEVEAARTNWQQRMRTRLTSHTPAKNPSSPSK